MMPFVVFCYQILPLHQELSLNYHTLIVSPNTVLTHGFNKLQRMNHVDQLTLHGLLLIVYHEVKWQQ